MVIALVRTVRWGGSICLDHSCLPGSPAATSQRGGGCVSLISYINRALLCNAHVAPAEQCRCQDTALKVCQTIPAKLLFRIHILLTRINGSGVFACAGSRCCQNILSSFCLICKNLHD
eukprot:4703448-Amphidinium_carterae.1